MSGTTVEKRKKRGTIECFNFYFQNVDKLEDCTPSVAVTLYCQYQ